MPIGVSTWCRTAAEAPLEFARRVGDLGAAGLLLATRSPGPWVEALQASRKQLGLPIWAVEAPCPRPRLSRDPALASADKDERRAAAAQVEEAVRLAGVLDARLVIVRLGQLPGVEDSDWQALVDRVRLGASPDEVRARWLKQRLAVAPRVLDHARFALEPLLARAEAAGVTLTLVSRARWFELPDAAEVGVLCEDFRGAPLAACYDAAAAHALATQGGAAEASFISDLGPRIAAVLRSDAAGLRGGLPWRRGQVDHPTILAACPAEALHIVHAAPGMLDHELAAALTP